MLIFLTYSGESEPPNVENQNTDTATTEGDLDQSQLYPSYTFFSDFMKIAMCFSPFSDT